MTFSDWASIGSGFLAMGAFAYSFLANRKEQRARRFELSSIHRNEVMKWYSETIEIITALNRSKEKPTGIDRASYLSRLSAKIEIGRFLYPNKMDGSGSNKLSAYQGKRNVILDCLVFIYELNMHPEFEKYQQHSAVLQKMFTSQVFEQLDPEKYIHEAKINANVSDKENVTLKDVIGSDPEELDSLLEFGIRKDSFTKKSELGELTIIHSEGDSRT